MSRYPVVVAGAPHMSAAPYVELLAATECTYDPAARPHCARGCRLADAELHINRISPGTPVSSTRGFSGAFRFRNVTFCADRATSTGVTTEPVYNTKAKSARIFVSENCSDPLFVVR